MEWLNAIYKKVVNGNSCRRYLKFSRKFQKNKLVLNGMFKISIMVFGFFMLNLLKGYYVTSERVLGTLKNKLREIICKKWKML